MLMRPTILPLLVLLAVGLGLSACGKSYRGHEPKAPPPAASSVPLQPPLLTVPAQPLAWDKPGVSDRQRQADVESCYAYARATIEHDIRIDSDRRAGLFNRDQGGLGDVALRQRMSRFSQENQQVRLMSDCMASKGYERGE